MKILAATIKGGRQKKRPSLQTGLILPRVWVPPLLGMVLWCLLKMLEALVVPEPCCEQGCCPGAEVGGQEPAWEPCQPLGSGSRVSLCRGIPQLGCTHSSAKQPLQRAAGSHHSPYPTNLSRPCISPHKGPRIGVFLACVTTGLSPGVRERGSAISPFCALLQISCKCVF